MYVVPLLIVIQIQLVSKCTFRHKQRNSIVCDSPSVCDNQNFGGTRTATEKICNQAYSIHMLVGIENGLYRLTSHIYTSRFLGFRNMQSTNNPKINICIYAYIHIYTLNKISDIYLYRSTGSGTSFKK